MRVCVTLLAMACVSTVVNAESGRIDPSTDLLVSAWSYAEPSSAKDSAPQTVAFPVWVSSDRYSAYFGPPGTGWDLAAVCRPERGVLEFVALGVDTPPTVESETLSIRGVGEQAKVVFDPDGMGSVRSGLPARGILRYSGTHGQAGKLRVPAVVSKIAAACPSSDVNERYAAPHDPVTAARSTS